MSMQGNCPHVSVVLLNWCAAPMAARCLESLLNSDYPDFSVVVCDNASPEHGLPELVAWARGESPVTGFEGELLRSVVPQPKPLDFCVFDRLAAVAGGNADDPRLVFIQTGENRGYAAGNNVGLEYVLARGQSRYVWLLNTDTLVEPGALSALVARAEMDKQIGMVGSTLIEMENPQRVQTCAGARYRKHKGDGAQIGSGSSLNTLPDRETVEGQLDFVIGASMLVRTDLMRKAGLICEDYFLYCEEMDWAIRGRLHGYRTAWAPDSRVYHCGGGSTPSFIASYFFYRNALIFARRYFPAYWPLQFFHLFKRWLKACSKRDTIKQRALAYVLTGRIPLECVRFITNAPSKMR